MVLVLVTPLVVVAVALVVVPDIIASGPNLRINKNFGKNNVPRIVVIESISPKDRITNLVCLSIVALESIGTRIRLLKNTL